MFAARAGHQYKIGFIGFLLNRADAANSRQTAGKTGHAIYHVYPRTLPLEQTFGCCHSGRTSEPLPTGHRRHGPDTSQRKREMQQPLEQAVAETILQRFESFYSRFLKR